MRTNDRRVQQPVDAGAGELEPLESRGPLDDIVRDDRIRQKYLGLAENGPEALARLFLALVLGARGLRVARPQRPPVAVDTALRPRQGGHVQMRICLANRLQKLVGKGQGDCDVDGALGHIDSELYEAAGSSANGERISELWGPGFRLLK
jgi:hypothetical protein